MRADTLKDLAEPAYLAVRQRHMDYEVETAFDIHFGRTGGCAGIAVMQNNENHVRAECFRENGKGAVRVIRCVQGVDEVLGLAAGIHKAITGMKVSVHGLLADIWYGCGEQWHALISDIDIRALSTESAGGFVGCTAGMYASGNGKDTGGYADFSYFTYRGLKTSAHCLNRPADHAPSENTSDK